MSSYVKKEGCSWPVLEPSWVEMFPNGRDLYYEGDDPEAFAKEMQEKYGFDPSLNNPSWSEYYGYSFHCPASALNEVYSDYSPYPLGS